MTKADMSKTQDPLGNEPQTKLNFKQKQAIWILSIGTFLEYFDLMLYVHMAVILNDLFFPKVNDPELKFIITAGAFCSTYMMRPVGALIFGYIGDKVGRKNTVIVTTFMMAVACVIMASLPTYKEIGKLATIAMFFCRMLQGMSSLGEVTGALVYLNEFIQPPARYKAIPLIPLATTVGFLAALGLAHFIVKYGMNWRNAFWGGAIIALVGVKARTALRETPEFADAKRRIKNYNLEHAHNFNEKKFDKDIKFYEKQSKPALKESAYLFILECLSPFCVYLSFFYCSDLLKIHFNYTGAMIIKQNFYLAVIALIKYLTLLWLCSKFNPLSVVKYQLYILSIILIIFPFLLYIKTTLLIFAIQILISVFALNVTIAASCMYEHFPVFKRVRLIALMRALSHSGTYIITSAGLVFLANKLGVTSISFVSAILCTGSIFGLKYFTKLHNEKAATKKETKSAVV